MSRVDRYIDHPVCANGHDLSSRHSYRRIANGARRCKRCAIAKLPARLQARYAARHTEAVRDRRNFLRRERRYRAQAQRLAVATSVRITTEQAKERNAA